MTVRTMAKVAGVGAGAWFAAGAIATIPGRNDADVPEPDRAAARAIADRAIADIDWNRPIIGVWVPGTLVHDVRWQLREEFDALAGDRGSLVKLTYPAAAVGIEQSVATGKEALRLLLEEVRRRDPDGTRYHVALEGESQGSWVINDLLAERPSTDVVDRVMLFGTPALTTHDGALDDDPRVKRLDHRMDPITWPFLGPTGDAASSGAAIFGHDRGAIPGTVRNALWNPVHAAVFAVAGVRLKVDGDRSAHPHIYDDDMRGGARWMLGREA